jgi:hypothetical protein
MHDPAPTGPVDHSLNDNIFCANAVGAAANELIMTVRPPTTSPGHMILALGRGDDRIGRYVAGLRASRASLVDAPTGPRRCAPVASKGSGPIAGRRGGEGLPREVESHIDACSTTSWPHDELSRRTDQSATSAAIRLRCRDEGRTVASVGGSAQRGAHALRRRLPTAGGARGCAPFPLIDRAEQGRRRCGAMNPCSRGGSRSARPCS